METQFDIDNSIQDLYSCISDTVYMELIYHHIGDSFLVLYQMGSKNTDYWNCPSTVFESIRRMIHSCSSILTTRCVLD